MIDEIHVRNVALIEDATLVPSASMTVLTGETGAGKTALLSACKLLMGARADKTMVREDTEESQVEGRFFLAGPDDGEEERREREWVVVRRLSADGRSRVAINGSMATVGELADLVSPTVDLCGQHEHQTLMRPSEHGRMLDGWARDEIAPLASAYEAAFAVHRDAQAAYERIKEAQESSEASLEEARFLLRQIEAVGIDEDDYDELRAYLDRTEHAETLARAADGAHRALTGEEGASAAVDAAVAALSEGARYDEALAPYIDSLREAGFVLEDVAREMASYRDEVEFDPAELARAQERFAALQGLLRNYGPRYEDLVSRRDECRELIAAVDDADERLASAQRALDEAETALCAAAEALTAVRARIAPRFAAEVSAVMGRLEMGSAQMLCAVEPLPRESWSINGPTKVEFLFKPAAAMQPRPLGRIASGGEMSRVMLAVHVVMGERDAVSTLVFDEVDAGVGGATATALAEVLADLAKSHQVLVVTHLAQVAVYGDAHYVVRKTEGGQEEAPHTELVAVEGAARTEEIARMLSGSATDHSLAHAEELLRSTSR